MKSYILKCLYKSYKKKISYKTSNKKRYENSFFNRFSNDLDLCLLFHFVRPKHTLPFQVVWSLYDDLKKKLKCFYRNWNTSRSKMILSPYFYSRTYVGWLVLGDHRNFKPKGKLIKSSILFTIYIFYRNYRDTQIVTFQQYISYKRYLNIRRQNSSKLKLPGLK